MVVGHSVERVGDPRGKGAGAAGSAEGVVAGRWQLRCGGAARRGRPQGVPVVDPVTRERRRWTSKALTGPTTCPRVVADGGGEADPPAARGGGADLWKPVEFRRRIGPPARMGEDASSRPEWGAGQAGHLPCPASASPPSGVMLCTICWQARGHGPHAEKRLAGRFRSRFCKRLSVFS